MRRGLGRMDPMRNPVVAFLIAFAVTLIASAPILALGFLGYYWTTGGS